MSEHIYTYDDPPSDRDLGKACNILEKGGVLVCPMGSSWSFICDAANHKALDRIHRLKPSHPNTQPFALVCSDMSMASNVGNIDHQQYRYLKKAWPGPFTIIVKRNRSLPRQIKDKRQVVGIRIPRCPMVLALVKKFGKPLASSSIPAKDDGSWHHMGYDIFETYGHAIDLLLDLGEELPCLESTVIDFSDGFPILVRDGEGDHSIFGDIASAD